MAKHLGMMGRIGCRTGMGLGLTLAAGLACPAVAQSATDAAGWTVIDSGTLAGARRVTTFQSTQPETAGLRSNGLVEIPGGALQPELPDADELVVIPAAADPIEITALIEFVQQALDINIMSIGEPAGQVVLNAEIEVPVSGLLRLLDAMLYRFGYTIGWDDDAKLYIVQETQNSVSGWEGELATAKRIRTPNIKPSLILPTVQSALGSGENDGTLIAVDETGVLLVFGSAKTIRVAEAVIAELTAAEAELKLHNIELQFVAASTARTRAISLTGGSSNASNPLQNLNRGQDPNQISLGFQGGSLDNLSDRLSISPTGNALLFRGVAEELDKVLQLIDLIDVPNTLTAKKYFAGASAQQIANIAEQRGLGKVTVLEAGQTDFDRRVQQAQFGQAGLSVGDEGGVGGSAMVVDIESGSIVYYGTASQQAELETILDDLKSDDERVVIRTYKMKHGLAEEVADLLDAIISGTQRTGDSPLLPETRVSNTPTRAVQQGESFAFVDGDGSDVSGDFDPDEVIVVPDVSNNQIVARAPIRQQDELARLINQLDQRRKQVYIEATIISVTDTENFRLAVETQILNGQYGIQSSFGGEDTLTSANGGGFLDQRTVSTGLGGLTAALIQSESIPFVINAIQTNTDGRVVSNPTLLVNDNEEGTIDSQEEQPTTTTSQSDNLTQTSFNGFESAGTSLSITPSISEEGYLTLNYTITSSNFTGEGSGGVPAPRLTNEVTSQVTVPSNTTIVVGGIRSSNVNDSEQKIPFLGDIPIIGNLFKDQSKIKSDTVLYIFITPKIMTDPSFRDLKLLVKGPQSLVDAPLDDLPELGPVLIRPAAIRPVPLESLLVPQPEVTTTIELPESDDDSAGEPADDAADEESATDEGVTS